MNCLTLPCRRGTQRGCVWVECSHPWKHAKTLLHFFAGHANRLRRFPSACEGRTFYGYRRSRAVLRLQTHMLQDDCDRLSIRPSTHAQSVGKASWQYAVSRRWDRSCWCLVLHPSQKGRVICTTTVLRFSSCLSLLEFSNLPILISLTVLSTHFHQASDDRYPYNMHRQHTRRNICRAISLRW